MSYCTLGFLEYGMTNAINYKCGFARDSNPKRGNTIDIYKLAHTWKRGSQDITDNIYLNHNKCNTLAEDGDTKKRWSGYYSEMLNETKQKSICCTREKLKEKNIRYPYRGDQEAAG